MKIVGFILSTLATLCYILIIGILVVAAPMITGYKPVVVLTGSMEPTYPVGSIIYYKGASFEDIEDGDPITFSVGNDKNAVVTHRVVEKDETTKSFITKGDNNATPDTNPVPYSNVMGKVMDYHLPVVGYFVQYIKNFFVIGGVFIILILKMIYDHIMYAKKEKDELVNLDV